MRTAPTWKRLALTALAATLTAVGCFTFEADRAADENEQSTGWQDRGRDPGRHSVTRDTTDPNAVWEYTLHYNDVIITPDGGHLFVQVPMPGPDKGWDEPGLVLTLRQLGRNEATVVFSDLTNVRRINFTPDGAAAFVLAEDGRKLVRIDLDTYQTMLLATFDEHYKVLDVSPDGRFVVATNIETHDLLEWLNINGECRDDASINHCAVGIWDNAALKLTELKREQRIRDLDFAPDGALLLTSSTWDEEGQPVASIAFVDAGTGTVEDTVSFPNCADELKLQPEGNLALLAPIRCNERNGNSADPISVIDLDARAFITNLPGFGPVGISEDGTRAVGFTRKDDMQNQWNYDQKEPTGLIVVSLPSLAWEVIEYGQEEPTYLVTGDDGRWIYAHHSTVLCEDQRGGGQTCHTDTSPLYLIDAETGTRAAVEGTDARLSQFVRADDTLFLLTKGVLTALQPGATTAVDKPLPYQPELMNITPNGTTIVFGEADAPTFYRSDVTTPDVLSPFTVKAGERERRL